MARRERVERSGEGYSLFQVTMTKMIEGFFWALNFRFREFLGRKICQVVFGLILIGIIWDIQNYLNFSFCFYVIAETESKTFVDVSGACC